MIAIVCMKWGTAYGAEYVNVLYRAVTRNLSHPFRFYCFTDDGAGLEDGILARPIPDMGLPPERIRRGCWPKVGLFRPGLIAEDTAMFIDLDVVVTRSLDPFIDRQIAVGGLHIIREWNPGIWNSVPLAWRPDRGGQSSVVCWRPSEQGQIYEDLMTNPAAAFSLAPNDQKHITRTAVARHYWPEGWTASFKRACVRYYPLNLFFREVRKPRRTRIIVFHGKPRPSDLIVQGNARWGTKKRFGYGPVQWVCDYWMDGFGKNLGNGVSSRGAHPALATHEANPLLGDSMDATSLASAMK